MLSFVGVSIHRPCTGAGRQHRGAAGAGGGPRCGAQLHRCGGERGATDPVGARGHERIFIRGDQDVLYQDFMEVMNKLQDNGFYSVALVGEDKSGVKS